MSYLLLLASRCICLEVASLFVLPCGVSGKTGLSISGGNISSSGSASKPGKNLAPSGVLNFGIKIYLNLTASLKASPALNFGVLSSGMVILWDGLRGLTPTRDAR